MNGFVLLVVSMLVGSHPRVLRYLAPGRAGRGWARADLHRLVAADQATGRHDSRSHRAETHRDWLQQSFYPLTLPLTVGPGSISVAVTLGANAAARTAPLLMVSVLAAAVIAVTIYLSCLVRASRARARRIGHQRLPAAVVFHPGLHRRPDFANGIKALKLL